jgi:ppGpp synthetase/RelA/SpoT-type nucleotidyltranferase
MAFPKLQYSRSQVDKAGEILLKNDNDEWSNTVLTNWRACHGYPVNTFQATLRKRLEHVDNKALVAQRIKRTPSIVNKLRRFGSMRLSQMQDIGGLRAIVGSLVQLDKLRKLYCDSKSKHKIVHTDDYIRNPKIDGYRSVHLVYKYVNKIQPAYDGFYVELQLRTRLQHAWATAVETMGTYLGQALKSRQGEQKWLDFFTVTGAAFAVIEKTPSVPGFEKCTKDEVFKQVVDAESKLKVLDSLSGFTVATHAITTSQKIGAYNLIVLDSNKKEVTVTSFSKEHLERAAEEYTKAELRARQGEKIEAVLVSAGPIEKLKKAYPNFFLDTSSFIAIVKRVIMKDFPVKQD